jgi:peroxiredoxin
MRGKVLGLLAIAAFSVPAAAAAQDAEVGYRVLEVGQEAPDFQLTGATRFGVLRDPVRLSDFRGKTVVLAFFPRVRTPG